MSALSHQAHRCGNGATDIVCPRAQRGEAGWLVGVMEPQFAGSSSARSRSSTQNDGKPEVGCAKAPERISGDIKQKRILVGQPITRSVRLLPRCGTLADIY